MVNILVDCDGVLLDSTPHVKRFYLKNVDPTAEIPDEVYPSQWPVWNRDIETWKKFMQGFVSSDEFGGIPPVEGAPAAVRALKEKGFRITVLTSCGGGEKARANRRKNLETHFGKDAFEDVVCLSLGWGNKKDVMKDPARKFRMLIDDSVHNARDALECGLHPIVLYHPDNRGHVLSVLKGRNIVVQALTGETVSESMNMLKKRGSIAMTWPGAVDAAARHGERLVWQERFNAAAFSRREVRDV